MKKPPKVIDQTEQQPSLDAVMMPVENPPVRTPTAKEEKLRDISGYFMDDESEARAVCYEIDDPVFISHVRRAHKYFTQHPDCRGKVWKVEVKGHDETTDKYSRLFFCRRESLPTPEEIRDFGVIGRFRFVLTYYDPFRQNRKTAGAARGGYTSILSGDFEIPAPMVHVMPGHRQQQQPASIMSEPKLMEQKNAITLLNDMVEQTMMLQMKIIANQGSIRDEGISIGRVMQQKDDLERKNAALAKQNADALARLSELQTTDENEQQEESPTVKIVSKIVDEFGPMAKAYLSKKMGGDDGDEDDDAPKIPAQE